MIHGGTQCSINVQTYLLSFAGGKGFCSTANSIKVSESTHLHGYSTINLKMAQERITEGITRHANAIIIYAVSINQWSQLHLIQKKPQVLNHPCRTRLNSYWS